MSSIANMLLCSPPKSQLQVAGHKLPRHWFTDDWLMNSWIKKRSDRRRTGEEQKNPDTKVQTVAPVGPYCFYHSVSLQLFMCCNVALLCSWLMDQQHKQEWPTNRLYHMFLTLPLLTTNTLQRTAFAYAQKRHNRFSLPCQTELHHQAT